MALRVAIDFCMTRATNKDEFQREMKKLGYDMVWTAERKYITYICPTQNGKECRVRDIKLNDEKYLKENIGAVVGFGIGAVIFGSTTTQANR